MIELWAPLDGKSRAADAVSVRHQVIDVIRSQRAYKGGRLGEGPGGPHTNNLLKFSHMQQIELVDLVL